MPDSHRFSVSVAGAVLRDDGTMLAIKRRDNGHWEPPGGILEAGEPMHDGLVREVLEETGLSVEPERLTGVYQNLERDIIALVFRCRVVAGHLRRSDETSELVWLTRADIIDRMAPAYAARLMDAFENAEPATRPHDGVSLI